MLVVIRLETCTSDRSSVAPPCSYNTSSHRILHLVFFFLLCAYYLNQNDLKHKQLKLSGSVSTKPEGIS